MAFLSGKSGSISLGGSSYNFGKWSFRMRGDAPLVTNFGSGGHEDDVPGIVGGDLTADGPYDQGNMPLTVLSTYAAVLTLVSGTTIGCTVRVLDVTPTVDVNDAVRLSISARAKGTFTAALA